METVYLLLVQAIMYNVLILPMRNGNNFKASSTLLKMLGSYPTYEEWKLHNPFNRSDYSICSYPTYEEWKLRNGDFVNTNLNRSSYPTYEEWKPYILVCPNYFTIIFVLILPMRNGNIFKFILIYLVIIFWFLSYL